MLSHRAGINSRIDVSCRREVCWVTADVNGVRRLVHSDIVDAHRRRRCALRIRPPTVDRDTFGLWAKNAGRARVMGEGRLGDG